MTNPNDLLIRQGSLDAIAVELRNIRERLDGHGNRIDRIDVSVKNVDKRVDNLKLEVVNAVHTAELDRLNSVNSIKMKMKDIDWRVHSIYTVLVFVGSFVYDTIKGWILRDH